MVFMDALWIWRSSKVNDGRSTSTRYRPNKSAFKDGILRFNPQVWQLRRRNVTTELGEESWGTVALKTHEISRGREDLGPGSRSASRRGMHERFTEGYEVCGMKFSKTCNFGAFFPERWGTM